MIKLEKYRGVLFSTLSEITSLIVGGTDKRKIFQTLLDGCLVALEAERVYLLELDDEKITKYSKSRTDDTVRIEEISETAVLRSWMIKEGENSKDFGKGQELAFDLPLLANRCLDGVEANRVIISSPLVARESLFGLLVAVHIGDAGRYAPEDVQLITVLANQAAVALENRLLYQRLEKDAITDGLTSVYNYRFLISSLEREIKRAARFKQSFSFVMIDVDNLKQFNDRLGHLFGSQVLKEIAQIIKKKCREIDLVSKYGGDEFGVILPRTDLDGAIVVTQRILEAVADKAFDGETKGLLTCSAGVSCFPHDGKTVREMIASADRALYEAKRRGKNMLCSTNHLVGDTTE